MTPTPRDREGSPENAWCPLVQRFRLRLLRAQSMRSRYRRDIRARRHRLPHSPRISIHRPMPAQLGRSADRPHLRLTAKLSSLDWGGDCKPISRENHREVSRPILGLISAYRKPSVTG